MNLTLFRRDFLQNKLLIIIIAAVTAMYSIVVISMFDPALGESLELMMESMPDLFAAFGMTNAGNTLIEFIANYLYGFLFVLLPLVLIVIVTNKLVVRPQDKGTLGWLLATPVSRSKIAVTKAVTLIYTILLEILWILLCCIGASEILFSGELDIPQFLLLNSGLFCLLSLFGGICFCSGCIFSDSTLGTGVSSGICIAFVLLQMLSQVGEKTEWLKYLTPLTLFDSTSIAQGDFSVVPILMLLLASIFFFGMGIFVFCKKDFSV